MHVLLLMRHYEDNPENIMVLHKAYDIEQSSIDNKYISPPLPDDVQEYCDLEDEAWGDLGSFRDRGIKADIIEIKM